MFELTFFCRMFELTFERVKGDYVILVSFLKIYSHTPFIKGATSEAEKNMGRVWESLNKE